ncbi:MAG: recombination regulator RecX [Azovibrio sp.]
MPESLRARALGYLARREHSRAELRRKLAAHAESAEMLDALLDELEKGRQLSDKRYAEARVVVRSGRYGNGRLAQELRQAGVDDEAIGLALAGGEDEMARCRAVWQKKFGVLPGTLPERMKQERFLQYRGFSRESIRQVLLGLSEENE